MVRLGFTPGWRVAPTRSVIRRFLIAEHPALRVDHAVGGVCGDDRAAAASRRGYAR
jgi:hypothetical protein